MALVIENGSIVTNANSYVTRAEFIAYATESGVTVPNTDPTDVMLVKAAQFIDAHEANLKGSRVDRAQRMAFPRSGLVIDGWAWDEDEIPRNVLLCQMAVALDLAQGIDPYNPPVNPARAVKRQRVEGAVEVEYMDGGNQKLGRTTRWNALLNSLLRSVMWGIEAVRA